MCTRSRALCAEPPPREGKDNIVTENIYSRPRIGTQQWTFI